MKPRFFSTQSKFRAWFEKFYQTEKELLVGFYKKHTGIESITWSESVDEALCFGWIDGIRRRIDEKSYSIRFTPRNPKSHWSDVNIKKVNELSKKGLMKPEGLAAFERREEKRSRQAAYEQKGVSLAPEYEKKLKEDKEAWSFFISLAPSYKKATIHWVMSAKREETRKRRLEVVRSCSLGKQKIPHLRKRT